MQLWGPRYNAYLVAASDRAVFTVGRLPDDGPGRDEVEQLADQMEAFLDGRRMSYRDVGRALGHHPSSLRYAAPTGRVLIRWDGARRPTIWMVPPPSVEPAETRVELAGRYLHASGPATPEAFAGWAGIPAARGRAAFDALADSLTPVDTPVGAAWILADDEDAFRRPVGRAPAAARLLPSGDTYFLLGEPTGRCWSLNRAIGRSCGRRGSGPVPWWSMARSRGRGGGLGRSSRSSPGVGSRRRRATPSRSRRSRSPYQHRRERSAFAGSPDG